MPIFFSHHSFRPSAHPLGSVVKIYPQSDLITSTPTTLVYIAITPHLDDFRSLQTGLSSPTLGQPHLSSCSIQGVIPNVSQFILQTHRKPPVDSRHTLDGLHSPYHVCPNLHVLWPGGSLQIHVLLNSLSLSGIQPLCPLYITQTNHTCSYPRHCFPLA